MYNIIIVFRLNAENVINNSLWIKSIHRICEKIFNR